MKFRLEYIQPFGNDVRWKVFDSFGRLSVFLETMHRYNLENIIDGVDGRFKVVKLYSFEPRNDEKV